MYIYLFHDIDGITIFLFIWCPWTFFGFSPFCILRMKDEGENQILPCRRRVELAWKKSKNSNSGRHELEENPLNTFLIKNCWLVIVVGVDPTTFNMIVFGFTLFFLNNRSVLPKSFFGYCVSHLFDNLTLAFGCFSSVEVWQVLTVYRRWPENRRRKEVTSSWAGFCFEVKMRVVKDMNHVWSFRRKRTLAIGNWGSGDGWICWMCKMRVLKVWWLCHGTMWKVRWDLWEPLW